MKKLYDDNYAYTIEAQELGEKFDAILDSFLETNCKEYNLVEVQHFLSQFVMDKVLWKDMNKISEKTNGH